MAHVILHSFFFHNMYPAILAHKPPFMKTEDHNKWLSTHAVILQLEP